MPTFAVVLPAAGASRRFGRDKLRAELAGRSVIRRSVDAFLARDDVTHVVVATADGTCDATLLEDTRVSVVAGAEHRCGSVLNAIRSLPDRVEWVAVHDAARPLVSRELIDRTFDAAVRYGAAVPCVRVTGTVKQTATDDALPALVLRTLPRRFLWSAQTPQIGRRTDLLRAADVCPEPLERVTDDAQLLELAGHRVTIVEGEERNLKITHAHDLRLAEDLLRGTANDTPPS
ncbi:MAG: IspD/TarI family cytidylyltransferase [Planctomycetota bacterium]